MENDDILYLRRLIGEKLSSVEFVLNYWQLRFDGQTLTVTSRMQVFNGDSSLGPGEVGFRDALVERIAKRVVEVTVTNGDRVELLFDDVGRIKISLRPEDILGGAESLRYDSFDGSCQVWRPNEIAG
jgi:hypothetical protein